jgi:ribokinase
MVKKMMVIGSLNMDMVIHSNRIPMVGETVLGGEFLMVPGGKGANQAVAAARLGGDVTMVGCIGNDSFGKDLLRNLSTNHVNVDPVKILDDVSTGVAMITVNDGDNSIIVAPGANSRLSTEYVKELEEMIKNSSILVLQLEIPLETVQSAIEIAHQHGVKVLLNPAPAIKLDDDFLSKIDIITPNESEAEILTGKPIDSIEDAKSAVVNLKKKGVKHVIITLGHRGVVYNNGDHISHKPSRKVETMDTTAAGDAFTGSLAYAFSNDKDIEEAIDLAVMVGALTVTKKGAQTSIPYMKEVIQFANGYR